jgi:hypothetical protein
VAVAFLLGSRARPLRYARARDLTIPSKARKTTVRLAVRDQSGWVIASSPRLLSVIPSFPPVFSMSPAFRASERRVRDPRLPFAPVQRTTERAASGWPHLMRAEKQALCC